MESPHRIEDIIAKEIEKFPQNWDGKTQLFTSNVADKNEIVTNQQFFMLTQNDIDVMHDENNKYSGYFYKDYPNYDIRVIVINAYEVPNQISGTGNTNWDGSGLSDAQKNWLSNVALNTDKNCLIIGHLEGGGGIESLLTSYAKKGGKIIAYLHGHGHVDAFKDKTYFCDIAVKNAFGEDDSYCAFSVFSIDIENKRIYETRIGSGNDRTFDYENRTQI